MKGLSRRSSQLLLQKETVFIIGAGASFELKLPLGSALREEIAELVDIRYDLNRQISGDEQIDHHLREIAREAGQATIKELLQKCWLMRDALPGSISIDNLIDAHRNDDAFAEIGKMAIAKAILSAERKSKLFFDQRRGENFSLRSVDGTYLIPILQILTENVPREDVASIFSNVSFVVFNYDRCLEFFLPHALMAYYGLPRSEAEAVCDTARIIHPYGRVGEFGRGQSLSTAGFGSESGNIREIAQGIRTFSEGLAEDEAGAEISSAIGQADQIVFLGFAFHPMNMEILRPRGFSLVTEVYGTTHGLSDAAIRSVESGLLQALGKRAPDDLMPPPEAHEILDELNLEGRTAADFLQAHFRGIADN
ncbi:hypothetical protein K3162_07345 [Qipengyuania xiapuensis]|uniref:SIR2-like domain-containing protein n=1 Tax=Qipengyuania xiapuensis TaxID=2867236 RepID=A0ABX8ZR51_9SPHN|nr:hypothetical protein [Qipengyuania xiapuensis]QZD91392.1 hypothetical protein K3162_07345 [Qipengyuania xiapuensis]